MNRNGRCESPAIKILQPQKKYGVDEGDENERGCHKSIFY